MFNLAIYSNVPANPDDPDGFSRPGELLWQDYRRATRERVYAIADEQFYDPNPNAIMGQDSEVWQFNFEMDAANACWQDEGEIYWLGINHTFDLADAVGVPGGGDGVVNSADLNYLLALETAAGAPVGFGWKTSGAQQFEDDAVWTDVPGLFEPPFFQSPPNVVPTGGWNPLISPFTGESLDLSFVIVPEPVTMLLLGIGSVALIRRRRL